MALTVEMVCLGKLVFRFPRKISLFPSYLLAAFGSIRAGGGMRPGGAARSNRLLNVGPPKVAARLSLGETMEDGESVMSVEVGDIGSGTAVAKTDKFGKL